MLIDYPWYYILLCLALGVVFSAALYRWGRHFGRKVDAVLALLRWAAVSAIAMLLLAPVARRTVHERQQPQVCLIEDRSQSVQMSADSSFSLSTLQKKLDGHCRTTLANNGSNTLQTDLGALLDTLPPDVAAVVLSSDGINNHGQNPVSVAERLDVPVYTVALGDTTPRRDAVLSNLRHNRIAYLGTTFPIEVTVSARLLRGHNAMLTIADANGHTVASQRVDYNDDNFSVTLALPVPAGAKGLQRYAVALQVVEGEASADNNRQSFYVDVVDGRRKVAIVGHSLHPDMAALRRAVESNPNFTASVFTADDVQRNQRSLKDSAFSLVIYHNLPSASHALPQIFDGLPNIFIIGLQTDLPRFNALHGGLEIVSRAKKGNEMTALYNDRFSLFSFEPSDGTLFEQFPPLDVPFGEARTTSALQTLFTARLGNIDSRQPLVSALSQGQRHTVFVWGEGLWRWRLADYHDNASHEHFDRLVSQMVTFSATDGQRDRFVVDAERHYSDAEPVVLGAQLYNDAYELFNTPDAVLTLVGDSAKGDFDFTRRGNAYTLSLGRLPEGLYRYSARTTYNGATLTTEGSFAVEALNLESSNLTANHALLQSVSTVSGGRMFHTDQLDMLRDEILTIKPTIYTHTRFSELLGLPWVLLLIVLLLTTEWVLRKYHGGI